MIVIGENINIVSRKLGPAIRDRKARIVQEAAVKLVEAGADLLDLNIGPARRNGEELMEWMVQTVQAVVDVPLFLDTMNTAALEAGCRVYEERQGPLVINSIMASADRMEEQLPLVKRHRVGFVALMLGPDGLPKDENERGLLASDLVVEALQMGVPARDIWIDPIVLPVSSQQNELQGCTRFTAMVPEIFPDCRTTCGLSNVSSGCPQRLRSLVNRTYLSMLLRCGLKSAVLDPFDREVMAVAKGRRNDLDDLVGSVMDGAEIDMGSLCREERDHVMTARILLARDVYSASWLDQQPRDPPGRRKPGFRPRPDRKERR